MTAPWLADWAMPTRSCSGAGSVGEVREGRLASYRDVGAQNEEEDRVDRLCVSTDRDRAPDRREVDEREGELEPSGPNAVESVLAALVGLCLADRGSARPHFNEHTWKGGAGLVPHGACERRLRRGNRGGQQSRTRPRGALEVSEFEPSGSWQFSLDTLLYAA